MKKILKKILSKLSRIFYSKRNQEVFYVNELFSRNDILGEALSNDWNTEWGNLILTFIETDRINGYIGKEYLKHLQQVSDGTKVYTVDNTGKRVVFRKPRNASYKELQCFEMLNWKNEKG